MFLLYENTWSMVGFVQKCILPQQRSITWLLCLKNSFPLWAEPPDDLHLGTPGRHSGCTITRLVAMYPFPSLERNCIVYGCFNSLIMDIASSKNKGCQDGPPKSTLLCFMSTLQRIASWYISSLIANNTWIKHLAVAPISNSRRFICSG